jgi:hypothetical protein
MKTGIFAFVLLTIPFSTPANAACKQGQVMRTNTQGQQQCVNGKATFQDCVYGGMQLGHGKDAAERYCQAKGAARKG